MWNSIERCISLKALLKLRKRNKISAINVAISPFSLYFIIYFHFDWFAYLIYYFILRFIFFIYNIFWNVFGSVRWAFNKEASGIHNVYKIKPNIFPMNPDQLHRTRINIPYFMTVQYNTAGSDPLFFFYAQTSSFNVVPFAVVWRRLWHCPLCLLSEIIRVWYAHRSVRYIPYSPFEWVAMKKESFTNHYGQWPPLFCAIRY